MTGREFRNRLRELSYTCGMNQRYHQKLKRLWAVTDRAVRASVGVLAVAAAVLAVPPLGTEWASFWAGVAAAAVAVVLNVVPIGDWEKTHGELFRLWSDLRKDVEQDALKACGLKPDGEAPDHCAERMCELTGKEHALDAVEPAPFESLLRRCRADENRARGYGAARAGKPVAQVIPPAGAV